MENIKKILLVGSSFSAAPIYFSLKRYGYHITVCGSVKSDPCHEYADASIYADYSNKEVLLKIVEENSFDYIVPTCNDYSYLSSSWVANQLGYPGFDTTEITEILHTKKYFRARTAEFNLPAPKLIQESNYALSNVALPYLVKPVDSFSGRGVTKVDAFDFMAEAIHEARTESRSGEIVIEEFVEGSLHSHSAFILDNKISIDFFVDEFCTNYPYQVNCSNYPSYLSADVRLGMRTAIEKLAQELNIANGLLHTQFMSDGENFWIIECMRRCPGDLYGAMIERSTGIDYTDLFVQPFLGKRYAGDVVKSSELFIGRHTISSSKALVNFSFSPKILAEELEIIPLKSSGEKLEKAPFDKLAILLARFSNMETMLLETKNFFKNVRINHLDHF